MLVEVWSDIVCPFCYIGKHRLDLALAQTDLADEVDVVWRSFELNPDAPAEWNHAAALARKFGMTVAEVDHQHDVFAARALAQDSLTYHFDRVRSGSTFDAHQLLHLARDYGLQSELQEVFLRAVFVDGRPIGDRTTLVELAAQVGIDSESARVALTEQRFASAVREDEARAARQGAQGVPYFLVNGEMSFYGAVPVEDLAAALRAAAGQVSSGVRR